MKPPALPPKKKVCNLIAEKKLIKTPKKSAFRRSISLTNVIDLDVTFIKAFQDIKVQTNPIENQPIYGAMKEAPEMAPTQTTDESDHITNDDELKPPPLPPKKKKDGNLIVEEKLNLIENEPIYDVPRSDIRAIDEAPDMETTQTTDGSDSSFCSDQLTDASSFGSVSSDHTYDTVHSEDHLLSLVGWLKAEEERDFRWRSLNPPLKPSMSIEAVCR